MRQLNPVGVAILLFLRLGLVSVLPFWVGFTFDPAEAAERPEQCNPNDPDTCRDSDDGQRDHKDRNKPRSDSAPQG